jgi:BirA family biotin operon repressor/biotin-[acetyl-CoA-carboxylase] ligase
MISTRKHLLSCLKENIRQWISGEQISDQLGISRTAIWKQIKQLKKDGYDIQSAPKKGYRLEQMADILVAEEIQAKLDTKIIGRPSVVVFKETDSTNHQAKILAANGNAEGTLVIADSQRQGRGRLGRVWFSPPGQNLYVSIILRPPIPPSQAPQLTLMSAVALALTLQQVGLNAKIKWPNDILINQKKVAGILTEIGMEMDRVNWVVVGIGVNVNPSTHAIPFEIQPIATSIRIEKGTRFARTDLLCRLLKNFEMCYEQLKTEGFVPIMAQWREMTHIIGQQVYVDIMSHRIFGRVKAVDDDGVLLLEDAQGKIHRIFSGDVTRVRLEQT